MEDFLIVKIPRTESKTVEFKMAFNQDAIVALVAFANAEGGDVFIGVRDDGKVVGVQLASESETAWVNEVKSKTAPAIVPEAECPLFPSSPLRCRAATTSARGRRTI